MSSDHPASARDRAVRRVVWITLALNLVVAVAKIAYGYAAGALAIRADGFHSLTDATNNVAGLVGIYVASRPPDPEHPYGHRKFEIVATLVVGVSLLAMAYEVLRGAYQRFATGLGEAVPRIDAAAFIVLAGTLAVNIFVARYERRKADELESPFLLADATHTRADVLVTLGVIVAVALVRAGYPAFDTLAALGVAGFIGWAGIDVLRKNLNYLADVSLLDPEEVRHAVLAVPGVASTHKIRTRGVPGAVYVDLHIQIAPHLDVVRAHQVTHWVIDALKEARPEIQDVVVHTEPAAPGQRYNRLPWEDEPSHP
jgi:cation diffusion facilitator family transporter